jgi:hypothetical protein
VLGYHKGVLRRPVGEDVVEVPGPPLKQFNAEVTTLAFPLWMPLLLLGGYTLVTLFRSRIRRYRRRTGGRCSECGYDLFGNESGVCPECGTACDAAGKTM